MPTMNRSVDAKCPFYVGGNSREVSCEGLMNAERTIMSFRTKNECLMHMESFCNYNFEQCSLYKEIYRKYE